MLPAVALAASCACASAPEDVDEADVLDDAAEEVAIPATLPQHPRLFVTAADFAALKTRLQNKEQPWTDWYADLVAQWDAILAAEGGTPTDPDYTGKVDKLGKPIKKSTKDWTGTAQSWLLNLSFLHRMTSNEVYLKRALHTMEFMAAHPWDDKNAFGALDIAQGTAAMAIAYDGLYPALTAPQRKKYAAQIVEKGLSWAADVYSGKFKVWGRGNPLEEPFQRMYESNRNLVPNGAFGIGALAVHGDTTSPTVKTVIDGAINSLRPAIARFGRDGGCNEGPGYIGYGAPAAIRFIASLDAATNTTYGLVTPDTGFAKLSNFYLHMVGPTKLAFNFGDSGVGTWQGNTVQPITPNQEMQWLSEKYGGPYRPEWASRDRSGSVFGLLFYKGKQEDFTNLPLAKHFRPADLEDGSVELVSLREKWGDPEASWVAFKAGNNEGDHFQSDLGSFVIDMLGKRWAFDLGHHHYPSGPNHWQYAGRAGQNTLLIKATSDDSFNEDGPQQIGFSLGSPTLGKTPVVNAPVTAFDAGSRPFGIVDLTDAYDAAEVSSVRRGIRLIANRTSVLVVDQIFAKKAVDIQWQMHLNGPLSKSNPAFAGAAKIESISADGKRAVLEQGGELVTVHLLTPTTGAKLDQLVIVDPATGRRPASDPFTKLIVNVMNVPANQSATISVAVTPGKHATTDQSLRNEQKSLDKW